MIEDRLKKLRKKVRINSKKVVNSIINDPNTNSCAFCGAINKITKEHVIPKWAFNNNPQKGFISPINGLNQKYSKTTIPACFECNSYILGELEKFIEYEFRKTDDLKEGLKEDVLEKTILWLEIIDYKYQYLDLRRKFKKHKDTNFIRFLSEIPIGIMQDVELSPAKVYTNLRIAFTKLSVKSKAKRINSILIFKTSNKEFHFFHKRNDYIFIELPEYRIAIFYFLSKSFTTNIDAHESAMKIIQKIY